MTSCNAENEPEPRVVDLSRYECGRTGINEQVRTGYMNNDERGSIWRKWDLQVHTPYSHLNNQFGDDFDFYAKELFSRAVENEIRVIGVADYFTIDGYKALRALLADEARLAAVCDSDDEMIGAVNRITLFPNVEIRLSTLVGSDRVNLHVVFSDELDPEDIEQNFLHELNCLYEGTPQERDKSLKLHPRNIEKLGARLKQEHDRFRGESDMFIGMKNAVVDHSEISEVLERRPIFRGKYVLGIPSDEDLSRVSWDGQDHNVRKVLIQKSDFLFAANPKTVDWALGRKSPSLEEHEKEFKGRKPCFNSSDAHAFGEMFIPSEGRHTWVKADPTFNGLLQVLNEPSDRVYIGTEPEILNRVRTNPTRYIKSVSISKSEETDFEEVWFDTSLELNYGLVAIIGNKGSGKSALADIIGLTGHSVHGQPDTAEHFSFLNSEKFRRKKDNKSRHFECRLVWRSEGDQVVHNLGDAVATNEIERVKYIPQSYLERICSDIGSVRETGFQQELEAAIFTGLSDADKLGKPSLSELIAYETEETRHRIAQLKAEIEDDVDNLVSCYKRADPRFREELEKRIKQKELELESVQSTRPEEIAKPPEAAENTELLSEIEVARQALGETKLSADQAEKKKLELAKTVAICRKLDGSLDNLESQVASATEEIREYCEVLEIDFESVVSFELNRVQLQSKFDSASDELEKIDWQLDDSNEGSLSESKVTAEAKLQRLLAELAGPEKKYQTYLKELKDWQERCEQIEGTREISGSLAQLRVELEELDGLQESLENARHACIKHALDVLAEIGQTKDMYQKRHKPIQDSVDKHELVKNNLSFSVSVTPTNFESAFLNFIDQGRRGAFHGIDAGTANLRTIVEETDFETAEGVEEFLRRILDALEELPNGGRQSHPETQLRSSIDISQLYNYLFSLDYLLPQYSLLWQGKQVDQLSPGERGTLLLIFYLLVDTGEVPLIIDQPEENLDNQTVYKVLVQAIKEAKSRRQIIIVTHNPNLAVVCDAEQVIYADIDKENLNAVTYESGAIENPSINTHILNVLEGTRPAFHNRDSKYRPFDTTIQ